MSTSKSLLIVAALLAALSAVAAIWRPNQIDDGRIPLVWVSDNNPVRAEQIAHFNEGHPDMNLKLDYANAGLQKIVLQCASGVGPDIFDYTEEQLQALVEAGVLWDVTGAAAEMGFSAERDTWPAAKEQMTYFGRQYGYPCNVDVHLLIYNKNVFDSLGVPYPEGILTMEEFIALAQKVSGPGRFAVSGMNWRVFFSGLRGEYFTEDGRPDIANSEALKRAFTMHRDMIFKHKLMPTSVEMKAMSGRGGWGSGGSTLNQFSAGKFAMTLSGQWALIAFNRTYTHQIENLRKAGLKPEDIKNPLDRPMRIGAVMIPRFSEHPPSYRMISRLAGVNKYSAHRTAALSFLQYLAGQVYAESINRGVDALPGNPKYADSGVEAGPPDLAREELHTVTKKAVEYGYTPRRSPYLLTSDVIRTLETQTSRMESNPDIPIEKLLADAQRELETLMRRNLERNPKLKDLYNESFPKP
jgi:ABC-type glycerol-3-phosphate transport system substrate-binding protein